MSKLVIDPVIANRIKKAWNALSASQQVQLWPLIEKSHKQATTFSQAANDSKHHHQLMFVKSIITDDADHLIDTFNIPDIPSLGEYGEIWGKGKYEQLDAGWIETVACWLETFVIGLAPFPISIPVSIPIPDNLNIAIAGDWGTGNWRSSVNPPPSMKIKSLIHSFDPDLTIHLGDVYYAGTHDQEVNLFVDAWPSGKLGALALNSNHEMYSGSRNYVNDALGSKLFALQNKSNFFVLENTNWLIVGLDSAYYSLASNMHKNGLLWLDSPSIQLDFLKQQVAKNKKIIILTHHNGLEDDGSGATDLWNQVMMAFNNSGRSGPDYWYWGHAHIGAVYNTSNGVKCRCSGYGAIPWGYASKLDNNLNVKWFEKRNAQDPEIPQRVLNGFTMLSFDHTRLLEKFYDENGGLAWQS